MLRDTPWRTVGRQDGNPGLVFLMWQA